MSDTQMDYSAATSIDELYANLGASEIKRLYHENESFKTTLDKLNLTEGRAKLISDFQNQSEAEQQLAYARMSTVNKAIIDQDYDAFEAKQTQILAPSQDDTDAARAAEAVAVEPTPIEIEAVPVAEVVAPVVVESVEELYDGIEKIGASSYKLTVDPEDGTPVEIFFGTTQKECFKALRKSKGNATRELRRRAKKIQITDELRALKVEVVNYPPLATPVILTPDQIYTYTEQLKDPTTVLE